MIEVYGKEITAKEFVAAITLESFENFDGWRHAAGEEIADKMTQAEQIEVTKLQYELFQKIDILIKEF